MDIAQKVNCLKIAADLAKTTISDNDCNQESLLKLVKENYAELHKLINSSFELDDIEAGDIDAAVNVAADIASDLA